jgi:hypothetical protein
MTRSRAKPEVRCQADFRCSRKCRGPNNEEERPTERIFFRFSEIRATFPFSEWKETVWKRPKSPAGGG